MIFVIYIIILFSKKLILENKRIYILTFVVAMF